MRLLRIVLFVTSIISAVLAGQDYYKLLGVDRNADEKQIRNAYRQLSKKYHPDKNPDDESAQHKFMEISNAYDVLMDSEKRQIYDRFGEEGLQNGGQQQQQHNDPFRGFFGQQFNQGPPRGQDVQTFVEYSLKDFYNGNNHDLEISITDICETCDGSGSSDGLKHNCDKCNGHGRIIQTVNLGPGMMQRIETACPLCHGSGKQIKNKCKKCSGNGFYDHKKSINIHVSPGLPRNHVEVLENQGPRKPGIIAGNLHVVIKESASDNLGYRRVGNNLYRSEVLSLKEALYGDWSRSIDFFDNYDPKITISRKKGQSVQNGQVEIIRGKGMPIYNGNDEFGDLFIEYIVILPLGNKKLLKNLHDEL